MPEKIQNFKAALFALLGFALFSVNDTVIKLLAQSYSIPQTLFWTSIFVCVVLFVYAFLKGQKKAFHTSLLNWHLVRGLFMALMIFCNIYALIRLQITDFYAIVFTAPMVISFAAWVFLKDKLKKRQITTILAGFLAILYICRPSGNLFNDGALVALVGVFFFAFSTLLVRSKLKTEQPLLISMNGPAVTAIIALPLMAIFDLGWPLDAQDWLLFAASGTAAAFGGIFFSMGFQFASSAAVVAPFHYTQMIWGALLGYMVFGEIPSQDVVIGSAVLAILGVYLIYVEARIRKHTLLENENMIQHGPV